MCVKPFSIEVYIPFPYGGGIKTRSEKHTILAVVYESNSVKVKQKVFQSCTKLEEARSPTP